MLTLKSNETLMIELPDGLFKQVTHAELLSLVKHKRTKKPQSKIGVIKRSIGLYEYAKKNGVYTNGHSASSESIFKMRDKIMSKIAELPPEDREQFYTAFEVKHG